jgi:hypothetical protein
VNDGKITGNLTIFDGKKHGIPIFHFFPTNQSIESHDYVSILDVFGSVW